MTPYEAIETALAAMSPPPRLVNIGYSRQTGRDVERLVSEWEARPLGERPEWVALVAARTDTRWYDRLSGAASWQCLIHGRVRFPGYSTAAPFPSALLYFGDRPDAFGRAAARLGPVYRRLS